MSLTRGFAERAGAVVLASCLLLTATSGWASSGGTGRSPGCIHPSRAIQASYAPSAKSAANAERIIVGLIGAGTTAWNATLGGIMPAPEIVPKKVVRA